MFHSVLKCRRQQNRVNAIQDESGFWVDNQAGVKKAFFEYYHNLLGSRLERRVKVKKAIIKHGPTVPTEMAEELIKPYTSNEIKEAVFSIEEMKAPGPDGYGSAFFRDNWE